jgi:hypothetical protein
VTEHEESRPGVETEAAREVLSATGASISQGKRLVYRKRGRGYEVRYTPAIRRLAAISPEIKFDGFLLHPRDVATLSAWSFAELVTRARREGIELTELDPLGGRG